MTPDVHRTLAAEIPDTRASRTHHPGDQARGCGCRRGSRRSGEAGSAAAAGGLPQLPGTRLSAVEDMTADHAAEQSEQQNRPKVGNTLEEGPGDVDRAVAWSVGRGTLAFACGSSTVERYAGEPAAAGYQGLPGPCCCAGIALDGWPHRALHRQPGGFLGHKPLTAEDPAGRVTGWCAGTATSG